MAFTRNGNATNNIANLANQPVEPPATLKQKFDQIGQDLKNYINNIFLQELESTTDGDSGLDSIGMTPIVGLVATNPQQALEEIVAKTPINVLDGSITDLKLSNAPTDLKQRFANLKIVNVKDFGAVGDGITDDTNAFREGIKQVQFGGKLRVPKGEYLCSLFVSWDGSDPDFPGWFDPLYPPKNFIMEGDGDGTVIKAKPGIGYALRFSYGERTTPSPDSSKNILLRDFKIDANGEEYGLYAIACSGIEMNNLNISNYTASDANSLNSAGVRLDSCGRPKIENMYIDQSGNTCSGILLNQNCSDGYVSACDIIGGTDGIVLKQSNNLSISDSIIYLQTNSCIRAISTVSQTNAVRIYANELEPSSEGCVISLGDGADSTPSAYIQDFIISENIILLGADKGNGIIMGRTAYCKINDNMFSPVVSGIRSGKKGIWVKNDVGSDISGNKIKQIDTGGIGIKVDYATRTSVNFNEFHVLTNNATTKAIEVNDGTNIDIFGNKETSFSASAYFIHVTKIIPAARYVMNNGSGAIKSILYDAFTDFNEFGKYHTNGGLVLSDNTYNRNLLTLDTLRVWTDTSGGLRTKLGIPASLFDGVGLIERAPAPASATSTGKSGQFSTDSNYIYVCVATNTWKRVAISTW